MIFSVCIPTYNGEPFLEACLDSLRRQSFTDYEVVACDDASTDRTWEILERFAEQDDRYRIYRNPSNFGLVGNWKRCLELAKGEWIKFLFQDDTFDPKCLETFAKNLDPKRPLVFCRRRLEFTSEITSEIKYHYINLPSPDTLFQKRKFISPSEVIETVLTRTRQNFLGEPTACLLHRSVFEKYGYFNEHLVQFCDFEYWIRLAIHTGIVYLPETLVTFRIHTSSTSSYNRQKFRSEYLDNLLILHAWCYDPLYEPLRRQAKSLGINLKRKLAVQSWWLERYAHTLGKVHPDILEEWNTIKKTYPKLRHSWYILPLKTKHWLERLLLWRLKRS